MRTLITRQTMCDIYLDYRNNYLSLEVFAEHYGLRTDEALALVALCKTIFEQPHPEE